MEDRKILNKERKKRIWCGAFIGVSVGALLSLSEFAVFLLSGIVDPFLLLGIFSAAALPARTLYNIIGVEFYPYLLSSKFAIGVTDSIILGLIGAVCGLFLKKKKDSIGRSTD